MRRAIRYREVTGRMKRCPRSVNWTKIAEMRFVRCLDGTEQAKAGVSVRQRRRLIKDVLGLGKADDVDK